MQLSTLIVVQISNLFKGLPFRTILLPLNLFFREDRIHAFRMLPDVDQCDDLAFFGNTWVKSLINSSVSLRVQASDKLFSHVWLL